MRGSKCYEHGTNSSKEETKDNAESFLCKVFQTLSFIFKDTSQYVLTIVNIYVLHIPICVNTSQYTKLH